MWIARDKDGKLWLFKGKPIRNKKEGFWAIASPAEEGIGELPFTLFPEFQWEDEPIEVDLVDVNKSIITDKDCIDEVYWREVRNNAAIAAMQTILGRWNNLSLKLIFEDVARLSVNCADALIKN